MEEDFKLRLSLVHIVRGVHKTGERRVVSKTVHVRQSITFFRPFRLNIESLGLVIIFKLNIPEATAEVIDYRRFIVAFFLVVIAAADC